MFKLPDNMIKVEVPGATVDFFKYEEDSLTYYYFDSSLCTPPDPMVNAMLGLELISNENARLIMINHSIPNALFSRININFEYDIEKFNDEMKIEFKRKEETEMKTDFSNNKCGG